MNGIHSSSCMKTFVLRVGRWWTITSQDEEDYEDDGNHDILLSTITSRTGSYQSMPLVVRGKPGGHLPDDLWSWEVSLTKGPSRGTRPSFQHRKKERTFFEQAHSNGCGGHTSTAKCLPRKSWGKAPLNKARVSRDVRNVHSFDGIFFQNTTSCRIAGPSSIPKFGEWKKLRRHDCCDQELLNIIEKRLDVIEVEDKVKSEPTLGSDHSRCEVLGCKGDGF